MKQKKIKHFSLKKLRDIHYHRLINKVKRNFNVDMNDWISNPYTFLKSRFYMEFSCILVYLAQFTSITPNTFTITYALLGVLGAFLITLNSDFIILIGLLILFTKNVFDWGDGLLAKIKNQSSDLGGLLDSWGGIVGAYSFIGGFGFYLFNKTNEEYFLVIAFIIILLKALDLKDFAYQMSMYELFNTKNKRSVLNKLNLKKKPNYLSNKNSLINKLKNFIQNFLDDRSRSFDFILLLIFIDNFYLNIVLLEYVYYYILIRTGLLFLGGMYVTFKKKHLYKN